MTHRLHADAVTLRRDARTVSRNLSLAIPEGSFSVIVGPNACGKSTLLAALSRLLAPAEGRVVLDGRDIHSLPGREVARRLGLLPQSALAPDGITVAELVARGRYPHRPGSSGSARRWTPTGWCRSAFRPGRPASRPPGAAKYSTARSPHHG